MKKNAGNLENLTGFAADVWTRTAEPRAPNRT